MIKWIALTQLKILTALHDSWYQCNFCTIHYSMEPNKRTQIQLGYICNSVNTTPDL